VLDSMMPIFDLGWVGLEKVRKMSGKGLQKVWKFIFKIA